MPFDPPDLIATPPARPILDAVGLGSIVLDRTGSIVEANTVAHLLLGWPSGGLVGRDGHATFHHSRRDGTPYDRATCPLLGIAGSGRGATEDTDTFWRRDGLALPVWWTAAPVVVDGCSTGEPQCAIVFQDASSRRAAALRADERASAAEARRADAELAARAARVATSIAEAETERLTTLAALSDMLNNLDVRDGLDRIADMITASLADGCIIDRLDDEGRLNRVSVAARTVAADEARQTLQVMPAPTAASAGSLARVLAGVTDQAVITLPRPENNSRRAVAADPLDREQEALFVHLGAQHAVVVPLADTAGGVLGAMTWLRQDEDHPFNTADLLMARLFGLRIGQWMENLRVAELRQRAAVVLQRSLLTSPPVRDDVDIVVRYAPAAEGLEVGGDWYDAVVGADGNLVLAIGDVTGHDITAAARMAQVRSMLRFAAVHRTTDPAGVLAEVDDAFRSLTVGGLATSVVGAMTTEPDGTYQFVWSNAGHLPPLLVTADGTSTLLTRACDLILGVDAAAPRSNHREVVPPAATLLLYTDGLVERRGEDIQSGLDRLAATAAALAGRELSELCDELIARLTQEGGAMDDVALIAVRLRPTAGRATPGA